MAFKRSPVRPRLSPPNKNTTRNDRVVFFWVQLRWRSPLSAARLMLVGRVLIASKLRRFDPDYLHHKTTCNLQVVFQFYRLYKNFVILSYYLLFTDCHTLLSLFRRHRQILFYLYRLLYTCRKACE